MAEHIWTVLCERHLVDPVSKAITLLDLVEAISEEGLEHKLKDALNSGKRGVLLNVTMQLVSWWSRTGPKDETLQVRFVLRNPAGVDVFEQGGTIQWGEHVPALARVFVTLGRFPVTMFGLHWIAVEHLKQMKSGKSRWIAVTKIPLSVDKFTDATIGPEQPSGPIPYVPLGSS
jgi:hypothetical protein